MRQPKKRGGWQAGEGGACPDIEMLRVAEQLEVLASGGGPVLLGAEAKAALKALDLEPTVQVGALEGSLSLWRQRTVHLRLSGLGNLSNDGAGACTLEMILACHPSARLPMTQRMKGEKRCVSA